jgi:hypothetical protein
VSTIAMGPFEYRVRCNTRREISGCGTGMSTADPERRKDIAWEHLSLENGWSCRICGAIPDVGVQFENNLCEDCRLSLRNYDPTAC